MIHTEMRANEYGFFIQMSVAAGSRKFYSHAQKPGKRNERSERGAKKPGT